QARLDRVARQSYRRRDLGVRLTDRDPPQHFVLARRQRDVETEKTLSARHTTFDPRIEDSFTSRGPADVVDEVGAGRVLQEAAGGREGSRRVQGHLLARSLPRQYARSRRRRPWDRVGPTARRRRTRWGDHRRQGAEAPLPRRLQRHPRLHRHSTAHRTYGCAEPWGVEHGSLDARRDRRAMGSLPEG